MRRTIAVAALTLALAACDSGPESETAGGTAEGEVLGGTISDEMLPLDTVRSQSPPLRTEPSEEGEGGEGASAEGGEAPEAQEPDEAENGEGADANPDAVPQIQLNPAPEPASPAPDEGDGDQATDP